MTTGSERGGLNYEINVTGNFEEKFARFEALLQKLETQAKVSGKTTATKEITKGSESVKAEERAQQKVIGTLNKKSAVEKKILQLRNRQQVAVSKQVSNEKVITDTVERKQKAEVAIQKVQLKTVKQSIALSKAEERIANTALKRLEIEKAIQLARKQGAVTPAQISQTTGLSTAALGKADKQIAAQNKALQNQERLRKQNLKIQKNQVTEGEKNRRLHKDILSFARKQKISLQRAAKELGVSASKAKLLGIEMNKVNDFASNFLFTFRRLVGILAIFTLARRFAGLIGNAVKEMSRFNSVLEQSRIGFAALLASAGEMVDANGQLVTGAEEYIQALDIAKDIQTKIRLSALGTVATYEDLLGAFQSGIGPGLAAGLNLDQIEAVTIALVKAASTLGVEGAQFTEEVRSIIQGTGALRTTRLLQIPGLSKENIRLAKEQGRLFDQIIDTLEPFNKATEDITKSWAGLQSQVKDVVSTLLASGSVEYFDTLKAAMDGFVNSLAKRDKILKDNFGLNNDAVAAVEEVSSALQAVVEDFGTLVSFDELFGSLKLNFAAIGEVLKLISAFLVPVIVGFGRGVTFVAAMLAGILKIGRVIFKIVPKTVVRGFKEILAFVSSIAGVLLTWLVLTKIYNGLLIATKTIIVSIGVLQSAYLLILEIISAVQKAHIAQKSILLAIAIAINSVVSITALVIGAIVLTVGVILVKTGKLSKLFGKINKSLDDSDSKLGKIKDSILGGTNAIFSQGEATKKLEASFKSLEERLIKMQNATKSLLLTSAIRGEAKQVFTAITSGLEKFANDSIELRKNIEQNETEIFKKEKIRNQARIKLEEELGNAQENRLFRLMLQQKRRLSLEGHAGHGREDFDRPPDVFQNQIKVQKELNIAEASLNATIQKSNKLQEVRQQLLQKNIALIQEKVRQETVSLNAELGGNKAINDRFELRKALILEEVRKTKKMVKALALQRVELQRQEEIKRNNDILDEKSISAINETIRLAKEANVDTESILALEAARDKTAERNLVRRRKEESIIRTMKKDLEIMANIVVSNDWLVAMSDGFRAGAQEFIRSADPLALRFADAMQNALEDAVDSASDAITDLFDPRTEGASAREVAGEILLGLANDLINTILSEFLQNMLTSFLGLQSTEQIQIAAIQANTAALGVVATALGADTAAGPLMGPPAPLMGPPAPSAPFVGPPAPLMGPPAPVDPILLAAMEANTAALAADTIATTADTTATVADTTATVVDATATTASAAATTVNSVATTANTGGIIANTVATITNTIKSIAAFIANTAATILNTLAQGIGGFFGQHGGLVTARGGFARNFAKGGWVNPLSIVPTYTSAQGFASGGDVKSHPRPSYISPVDTVPAWLQPGEYVIPKSRVAQYGAKFFEMIRRGSISPDMGMQHLTANITRSRGVYGLAQGGVVGTPSPSVAASRTSERSGGNIVLPVLVADDNTMDQIIAGGIDVFEQGVNDTPDFINQNESNS